MEAEAYRELHDLEPTHWWYAGMRGITETLLNTVLVGRHDLNILDAGCGAGGNLTALAPFGKAFGLDYSTLALGYASEAHRGKLARATVEALPYPDNAFDLVTSFDVLYCSEVHDDIRAMCEFARVVRPGGYVLLRLPALPSLKGPHDTFVHGARRYTDHDVRSKLAQAHLAVLRTTYANSLLMPLIFAIRKIQSLEVSMGSPVKSDVNPAPQPVSAVLKAVLALEARWIKSGHNFPAGVSLFCLATKPRDHFSRPISSPIASV